MEELFEFLDQLSRHNRREWFQENKGRYQACRERFEGVVTQLIAGIGSFEPALATLKASDCIYRIYRDVRFSPNKDPYKTHFAAYINLGGKKSDYSGYYLHLSNNEPGEFYPHGCFLAAGDYVCQPEVLKILREDISAGQGDFEATLQNAQDFYLDRSSALKRIPKGFSENDPYAPYIKLKNFCLIHPFDATLALQDDFVEKMTNLCRQAQPFLAYINRAVDYAKGID